ncbi:MAG: alpha/beta fold hydrolase [Acidobacteriia bacterium]|nr:alpha/beta fold hydrolase [Terriglobia bacterium]
MKSTWQYKYAIAFGVVAAVAVWVIPGAAQDKASAGGGKVEKILVHGRSLEGNLEGDSPDRDVAVYLPPSYSKERNRRYPVVYLLHGYGRTADDWYPFIGLPGSMDRNIAAGTAKEMILVIPDANTLYGGSMYSSSPTNGDWETYVTHDLVSYVDSHYRTIANRNSRGLGGHSMGGYGVWRLAMRYPDVYSAVYGLSACCLMNNPRPPGEGRGGQAKAKGPAQAKGDGQGKGQPPADAVRPGAHGGHPVNVAYGEAAAWSPNPMNPPLFFDQPVKDGQFQPDVAAKWVANSPLAMLDQYVPNMKKYSAIAMDIGLQDSLLESNKQLDEAMTRLGIPHTFETYEGNHNNHLEDRIEGKVLPFFSKHLKP